MLTPLPPPPPSMVDKEIKRYIDKIHTKKVSETENKRITYMKLSYIGKFSKFAQNKIMRFCETFCRETYNTCSLVFCNKIVL